MTTCHKCCQREATQTLKAIVLWGEKARVCESCLEEPKQVLLDWYRLMHSATNPHQWKAEALPPLSQDTLKYYLAPMLPSERRIWYLLAVAEAWQKGGATQVSMNVQQPFREGVRWQLKLMLTATRNMPDSERIPLFQHAFALCAIEHPPELTFAQVFSPTHSHHDSPTTHRNFL